MSLRIGIVGLGVISRYYLAALDAVPDVRLGAVCDTDPDRLAAHPGVPAYRDHRALLAAGDVDAVVVTVPNDLHAPICRDVLTAGMPVCVEKPLATTLDEGLAVDRLAADRGVPLFTAFHRRYNTSVRELVRAAPDPVAVTVRYHERIEEHVGADRWYLDPARTGGGCVADNGPNAYDLARLLLGELTVTGARIGVDAAGVDRTALVDLRADSGATCRVDLDWSYPRGERKDIEVRLADGTVRRADMLAGHDGFKASLWHEYRAIVRGFAAVATGRVDHRTDGGLAALSLVTDTYRLGLPTATPVRVGAERPGRVAR